ncbi:IS6 family transposase [Paraburkholderia sp. IW21]|uniref:IS6 family transposase n=1 Tax=Paraburkholderia sp. IW21 TaxID=3242488 RepID=UPI0035202142
MLLSVRWYVAYLLSLRNLEEMMAGRGIAVDHLTVHRWVIKLMRQESWRMDESVSRTQAKACGVIDFLFRAKRDQVAARRVFEKSIAQNNAPETPTIDKGGSNPAALHAVNAEGETPIKIRQVKYLNNVVEQDHRDIKRVTRQTLGFKDFHCARIILSGIELMRMIKKGQMKSRGKTPLSAAQQFYSLAS